MTTTVSIKYCTTYDRNVVAAAVRDSVDLLGGMASFLRPGDRVLIKPNLLKAASPEAAVTTHPEVLRAVIRLVHEAGGTVVVGDSPGIGDFRRICEKTGIRAVVEDEGAVLMDLNEALVVKNHGRFQRFEVSRIAAESDVIINLPKLKTHGMTVLTGAVKNLFGCIPGKRKVQWHFNSGVNHRAFTRMLAELAGLLKPRLTIMDAVVGMEGNGPGSGDPRLIGAILASADAVALDVVAAVMVGLEAGELPVIAAAAEAGIGETALEKIALAGDPLRIVKNFRIPPREHSEWRLPDWMRRRLKDALTTRPVIDQHACIRCGICREHCPQQVIADHGRGLVVDYRNCIRCFCCQEFCPQGAITVGKGWMLKLLRQ